MPQSSLQTEIGKKKPFDSAELEAYLNIMRTAAELSVPIERILREHNLSGATYNALRILRGHKQCGESGVPCQTIGQQLIARVPDVTRLVDRLVESGLAERERTEEDRRVVLVKITRAGLDLLAKLDKPLMDAHRAQLGHIPKRDLIELSRLLVEARTKPSPG